MKLNTDKFTKQQLEHLEQFCLDMSEDSLDNDSTESEEATENKPFIIPITASKGHEKDKVPVYRSCNFQLSQVTIHPNFPFQLNFVMTANRAQGQTLEKIFPALSYREGTSFNPTFQAVYVEMSRVHEDDNMRLLLTGETEAQKWMSLDYISTLKPPAASFALRAGFQHNGGRGWEDVAWDADSAYSALLRI